MFSVEVFRPALGSLAGLQAVFGSSGFLTNASGDCFQPLETEFQISRRNPNSNRHGVIYIDFTAVFVISGRKQTISWPCEMDCPNWSSSSNSTVNLVHLQHLWSLRDLCRDNHPGASRNVDGLKDIAEHFDREPHRQHEIRLRRGPAADKLRKNKDPCLLGNDAPH